MRRILVGVDGSAPSARALEWAIHYARMSGGTVEVVHAWNDPYIGMYPTATSMRYDANILARASNSLLEAAIAKCDISGVDVSYASVHGSPTRVLLERAKGAELVVIGTRGRGGFAGLLLGSVSNQLTQHGPCPVLVVPPERG